MPSINGPIAGDVAPTAILSVGVSPERRAALVRVGFPVPQPVLVTALLDTGAHIAAFPLSLFQQFQIPAISQVAVFTSSTPTGQPEYYDLFEVFIQIEMGGTLHDVGMFQAFALDNWQAHENYTGLVGRDFLGSFTFLCDGANGTFTLTM